MPVSVPVVVAGGGLAAPVERELDGLVGDEPGRSGRPPGEVVRREMSHLAPVHPGEEALAHPQRLAAEPGGEQGERGFCGNCGTPVLWRNPLEPQQISTTIGSFDHPELVKPTISYGGEAKIAWTDEAVHRVPIVIGEGVTANWPAEIVRSSSHQHPDHDTEHWTPHPSNAL